MVVPFSPDVLTVRDTETVWYEQCVTRYGAVLDLQCRRTDVVHHFRSTGIHYLSPNWLLRWLRRSRQTCSQLAVQEDGCGAPLQVHWDTLPLA
ncbi:hypothetical protein J6590_035882 [Homalodisca vitripennis]|nr:hypothetical protein J6590_035882 [Homalodisca vitripennis]